MSIEYDNYIVEHIANVRKGRKWFNENLPDLINEFIPVFISFTDHDNSKYDIEEYEPYDDYFYGKEKSALIKKNYDYAWLHHIHNNPHHWQYWVLINDEPNEGPKALEMPNRYIFEMICDWWAFSWKTGNLTEIFRWYDEHKNSMILHPKTRIKVERILNELKKKLEETENK